MCFTDKINDRFLNDIDIKILRSTVKEIFEHLNDFLSSILYSPQDCKGLGLMKASWEAYIQHSNINKNLIKVSDPNTTKFQNL